MQQEIIRSQARDILNKLPEPRLTSVLNYLKLLEQFPEDQLNLLEEMFENLGWSILASEVVE